MFIIETNKIEESVPYIMHYSWGLVPDIGG